MVCSDAHTTVRVFKLSPGFPTLLYELWHKNSRVAPVPELSLEPLSRKAYSGSKFDEKSVTQGQPGTAIL